MENDWFNSKIFCSEAESGKKKWAIKKVSEKTLIKIFYKKIHINSPASLAEAGFG